MTQIGKWSIDQLKSDLMGKNEIDKNQKIGNEKLYYDWKKRF